MVDVTDKAAVDAMAERVARDLGRIDILVNNAGINIRKPPHALDIAEWNSVIQTNLTSAFLCSQAVYPAMKAAGGGKAAKDQLVRFGTKWLDLEAQALLDRIVELGVAVGQLAGAAMQAAA